MLKCNAELVDIVFRLMFETLWVPPYDRRRANPLLIEFERSARRTSVLLSVTDTASASGAQLRELGTAVGGLVRCVERIAEARLFPGAECAEALAQAARISDSLPAACGAAVRCR